MPSARADEFRRVATKLGFRRARQTGSQERWKHQDGRATTIPIHGGRHIGPPLSIESWSKLGIDENIFRSIAVTSGRQQDLSVDLHTSATGEIRLSGLACQFPITPHIGSNRLK